MINHKLKVVIFGTGWAFNNYIEHYRDEHDVVGVTDWDYAKHGNKIKGIPVLNPYNLGSIDFDKILICSTYIKEIKEQLEQKIQISEDMTLVPYKYQFKSGKPFEDAATRSFALEVIEYLSKFFAKKNVILYLDYGTLLGLVRDGDLIHWDDDVDLTINEVHMDTVMKFIPTLEGKLPFSDEVCWSCSCKETPTNEVRYISFKFTNRKNDKYNEFELGIRSRQIIGEFSVYLGHVPWVAYSKFFRGYEKLKLENKEFYTPIDYKEYLKSLYGNWHTPQQTSFEFEWAKEIDKTQFNHLIKPLFDREVF